MHLPTALTAAIAALAVAATPASAVVGGKDASPGEHPSVAHVSFGVFSCTGTLIAPTWVLSAGHCGSLTGVGLASPAAWPAQAVDVTIGSHRYGDGETVPVKRVLVSPQYLGLSQRHDVSLIELTRTSAKTPTPVVAPGDRSTWEPGDLTTIAGWGVTEEGGDELPDTLQKAQVPVTTDAYAGDAYGSAFDARTMVAAGFEQGGVDTCQGDSGGPLFASTGAGLRVAGVTSYGEGCARPGKPGVYAKAGEGPVREWIARTAPSGVATDTTTTSGGTKKGSRAARR